MVHHRNPDFQFQTQEPEYIRSWALVANAGAISGIHMDAGGLATYVRPILGVKIWYIGYNDVMPDLHDGWDKDKCLWHSVVLSPQDEL